MILVGLTRRWPCCSCFATNPRRSRNPLEKSAVRQDGGGSGGANWRRRSSNWGGVHWLSHFKTHASQNTPPAVGRLLHANRKPGKTPVSAEFFASKNSTPVRSFILSSSSSSSMSPPRILPPRRRRPPPTRTLLLGAGALLGVFAAASPCCACMALSHAGWGGARPSHPRRAVYAHERVPRRELPSP